MSIVLRLSHSITIKYNDSRLVKIRNDTFTFYCTGEEEISLVYLMSDIKKALLLITYGKGDSRKITVATLSFDIF